MRLAEQLTLSVVSHAHGPLVESLVRQLDALPELQDVHLVVTLNVADETFAFESQPARRLRIEVIRNATPMGFGANHNQAFERCATPWFSILNPDLSLPTDVFTPLFASAYGVDAAMVVPRVVNGAGAVEDSVRWNLTPWSLLKRRLKWAGESSMQDGSFRWFAGMFYLVRREAFHAIGGFDTNYFLYCEDFDLCARLHLKRHHIAFRPEVQVIHDAQRASRKSRKYLALHLRSMIRVWLSMPVWKIALRDSLKRLTG